MRHISDSGLALIQHFEGFSPRVYMCPAGYETIGYGHMVRTGEEFRDGITRRWATKLLRRDVRVAECVVLRLIEVPLSDGQFDALVSFTFNVGAGALQRSTLRRVVNREEHDEVPRQLMRWIYAGGRRLKGLVQRRQAEAERYMIA